MKKMKRMIALLLALVMLLGALTACGLGSPYGTYRALWMETAIISNWRRTEHTFWQWMWATSPERTPVPTALTGIRFILTALPAP